MNWVISSKIILFPFAIGLWLVAWSMRLVPRRRLQQHAFLKAAVMLSYGGAVVLLMATEIAFYKSLTGQGSLLRDNFFFGVFAIQGIVAFAVILNSEAALKRKEGEDG